MVRDRARRKATEGTRRKRPGARDVFVETDSDGSTRVPGHPPAKKGKPAADSGKPSAVSTQRSAISKTQKRKADTRKPKRQAAKGKGRKRKHKAPDPKPETRTAKPAGLSAGQRERLAELARLGVSVTIADAARILQVDEARLTAFIGQGPGRELWERARAEGRAELLQAIRIMAIGGEVQAQKLLATLLAHDDTLRIGAQRISAAEARELIGRSAQAVGLRVRVGEMLAPGADGAYAVGDLLGLIGTLWDKLSAERRRVQLLEHKLGEDADADRQLKLEQVRRRRRENEIAEGRLVEVEEVRRRIDRLCEVVRDQSRDLVDGIILKLSLPEPAIRRMEEARRVFLEQCADEMGKRIEN